MSTFARVSKDPLLHTTLLVLEASHIDGTCYKIVLVWLLLSRGSSTTTPLSSIIPSTAHGWLHNTSLQHPRLHYWTHIAHNKQRDRSEDIQFTMYGELLCIQQLELSSTSRSSVCDCTWRSHLTSNITGNLYYMFIEQLPRSFTY